MAIFNSYVKLPDSTRNCFVITVDFQNPENVFFQKKQQRDPALGDVLSLMFHTVEPREADICWGPSSSLPTSRASCGEGPMDPASGFEMMERFRTVIIVVIVGYSPRVIMVTVIRYTTYLQKMGTTWFWFWNHLRKHCFALILNLIPAFWSCICLNINYPKSYLVLIINPNGFVWKGLLSPPCGGRYWGTMRPHRSSPTSRPARARNVSFGTSWIASWAWRLCWRTRGCLDQTWQAGK